MSSKIAILLLFLVFLCACQNGNQEATPLVNGLEISKNEPQLTTVETLVLEYMPFQKEIISQGKIEARIHSDITFDLQERIEEIFVKTGQRVKRGELLARLRDVEIRHQLQKIDYQIQKAKVDLEARLISFGYTLKDSLSIPPSILKTARLESNLDGLAIDRSLTLYQLEHTRIRAPISGIIAEVEAQVGNSSSSYKKLCTIIDDHQLDAVFPILEQELPLLEKGQKVEIKPLHGLGKIYEAIIRTYLPQVNEQGMIKVFARLSAPDGQLLDGMNVSVFIQDKVDNQLVVPKSAVVDRQGRLVAFVHKEGTAHWKYVQIGFENSEYYAISEGLTEGDEVIVNNNFHLAHLEKVELKNGE